MNPHREIIRDALAEVRAVYEALARRPLPRQCEARTECCQFRLTGRTPQLTQGEALLAAQAFRATGRKTLPENQEGICPLLKPETGRCLIYPGRPFGCRTHFCAAAGGPHPRKQVIDLIRRLEIVDEKLGGDGPRAITAALDDALRKM